MSMWKNRDESLPGDGLHEQVSSSFRKMLCPENIWQAGLAKYSNHSVTELIAQSHRSA